jgi:hypothetical protein
VRIGWNLALRGVARNPFIEKVHDAQRPRFLQRDEHARGVDESSQKRAELRENRAQGNVGGEELRRAADDLTIALRTLERERPLPDPADRNDLFH